MESPNFYPDREPQLSLALYRGLKWSLVWPLFFGYFHGRIYGCEQVPPKGPAIVVSNHGTYFDPPFLSCALNRPVAFMAKEELFSVPLLGSFIRLYGAYPVKRGAGDRGAIRAALAALQQGWLVGVFLEGTRRDDGRIYDPKLGAAMIAAKAQVPLLPVALGGVENIFQAGSSWPRPAPLAIRVGELIPAPSSVKRPELERVTSLCQSRINDLLDLG
ncbi:MAG: lysophospholipid acyltransferase family protein [Cyanobacteriota bacterium]|jgi:1-acyl-sn-glycerol-3-phosphate acyltransferase